MGHEDRVHENESVPLRIIQEDDMELLYGLASLNTPPKKTLAEEASVGSSCGTSIQRKGDRHCPQRSSSTSMGVDHARFECIHAQIDDDGDTSLSITLHYYCMYQS